MHWRAVDFRLNLKMNQLSKSAPEVLSSFLKPASSAVLFVAESEQGGMDVAIIVRSHSLTKAGSIFS